MVQHVVRHRTHRHDADGFSLIELIMVVLIIAILIAVGVPTFLGSRKPAEDRQAQTLLRTSLAAAKTGAADTGDYAWVSPAAIAAEETSVRYLAAGAHARATLRQVSVDSGSFSGDTYVIFSSMAGNSGECFALLSLASGATQYQAVAAPSCTAGSFVPGVGWNPSW
jgi:type IV pilus assembly protein PilA